MDTDVSDLCCVNCQCPDYGKRGAGNLVCRKLFGKERWRFLRCRSCRQEFSERRGTALFGVQLPTEKALSVLEHIADGCGVRQTARLTGVTTNTVMRLTKKAGGQARAVHDQLAHHLRVGEVQLDEKWSFVGKKRGELRFPARRDRHRLGRLLGPRGLGGGKQVRHHRGPGQANVGLGAKTDR